MEEKEYPYSGFKNRGGAISMRPQIRAKVSYGGRSEYMFCLIDSGSDHTLINSEYAAALGIDLSRCPKLDMNGVLPGDVVAMVAEVRMEFIGFDEEFKIRAKFVPGMTTDVILGQSDFFEEFKVRFERKRQKFYLTRESNQ